ncbi:MAG: hypothetical protein P8J32_05830, partial [bacterium]|nr:hypothetical protein [bacterium]
DKVAAVSSWFTFYGDALISEGVVDTFDQIDWDAEAANPNQAAMTYADLTVSKDQAASTPREAVDLFQTGKDATDSAIAYVVRNITIPFARFAINKKMSIVNDYLRARKGSDAEARKEGAAGLLGSVLELATFSYINVALLPAISSALFRTIFGEDEEEMPKENVWREVAANVVVDVLPIPTPRAIGNATKGVLNAALFYPMDVMNEGSFALGEESFMEGYERWSRLGKGATVYSRGKRPSFMGQALQTLGPYGDFTLGYQDAIANSVRLTTSNRVVGSTGKEYFVRPEDKSMMMLHNFLATATYSAQLFGLSVKEVDYIIKEMDNLPKDRRLSSEESLAAYEAIAERYGNAVESELTGMNRLDSIIEGKNAFDMKDSFQRFSPTLKMAVKEDYLKTHFPEEYKMYMREARKLTLRLKDGKDYSLYIRDKRESMGAEEFSKFKTFLDSYLILSRPSFYVEEEYLRTLEE